MRRCAATRPALSRGLRGAGEIDRLIAGCAKNWTLERMAAVDRNILRLAVYEMRSGGEPPPAVIINEAVDIAKKYSTPTRARSSTASSTASTRTRCAMGIPEPPPRDAARP